MRPGWEKRENRNGLDLLASYNEPRGQKVLSILAHDAGGREIGNAHFEVIGDHLESFDTYVSPDMRHRGIATVMYNYAQELGNDLKPSGYQTGSGKKFWKARQAQAQKPQT
jgi:GNAT superfamily N-acetyltransferase